MRTIKSFTLFFCAFVAQSLICSQSAAHERVTQFQLPQQASPRSPKKCPCDSEYWLDNAQWFLSSLAGCIAKIPRETSSEQQKIIKRKLDERFPGYREGLRVKSKP